MHTCISSLDPIAISRNLLNSALESRCFPNPSARFAQIDLLARLTCSANPNCSTLGKAERSPVDGERQRSVPSHHPCTTIAWEFWFLDSDFWLLPAHQG